MRKRKQKPTTQERVVRVFVSSTFRDMQEEREELVKRVFPQLRKLCESRGVTWGEVDLRWGVTDEQKAEGKVLPICLAEIERSRPYFLGLLGERYGWVPEAIDPALIEQESWLAERLGKSVTELEILHGVLNDPEMAEHAFFYLRDPAYAADRAPEQFKELATAKEIAERSTEEAERCAEARRAGLRALKKRICESGLPVHEDYPNPRALGELVLSDLIAVIDGLYPEGSEPDPLTREAAEHEAFARSRAGVYIGRSGYTKRLDVHAKGDEPPLVVLGESGSGKSALLANWALSYREKHPDELVLMHFIGASPASSDWRAMLGRIMGEFDRRFELQLEIPDQPDQLRLAFATSLHMAAAKGKVLLVLDALNQLEDREGALDLVWLPPEIPSNVRLIVSTLPGRPLDELTRRGWPTLEVEPLEPPERQRLIVEYLAQYTKALDTARSRRIASAEQTSNPLFLRALLEELRLWGEHETLDQAIDDYLEARDPAELYAKILERYEQDYERERPGLVRDAMTLIWAAHRGLSEVELLDLLGVNGDSLPHAYWSPLFLAAEQALVVRSGLLGFAQDYLRQAVEHLYLESEEARVAHLRLADYFQARELGSRKIDELPWQLARAKAWQRLYDLFGELPFLEEAWETDDSAITAWWVQLETRSPFRLSTAYGRVVETPTEYELPCIDTIESLFYRTGHYEQALSLADYRIDFFRANGEWAELPLALMSKANNLHGHVDLDERMNLYLEADRICRELGDLRGLAASLGGQGGINSERGDHESAMAKYQEQEHICREIGDRDGLVSSLHNQATTLGNHGDYDGAMKVCLEVEGICRESGNRSGLANSLGAQGGVIFGAFLYGSRASNLGVSSDLNKAIALLNEEERICRELGHVAGVASSIGRQAQVHFYGRGDIETATALAKEEERICREIESFPGLAMAMATQARMKIETGQWKEALHLLENAYSLADQEGLHDLIQVIEPDLNSLRQRLGPSSRSRIRRSLRDLRRHRV